MDLIISERNRVNQRIKELDNVIEVFIFPNMGDGGLSTGAAYLAHVDKTADVPHRLTTVLKGDSPSDSEIKYSLEGSGLKFQKYDDIETRVAQLVAEGNVVARCKGGMEFGPRALGNRRRGNH